jgi:hypothetical protein
VLPEQAIPEPVVEKGSSLDDEYQQLMTNLSNGLGGDTVGEILVEDSPIEDSPVEDSPVVEANPPMEVAAPAAPQSWLERATADQIIDYITKEDPKAPVAVLKEQARISVANLRSYVRSLYDI